MVDAGGEYGVSVLAEAASTTALADVSCQLSKSLSATSWTPVFSVKAEANLNDWVLSDSGDDLRARCVFDSEQLLDFLEPYDEETVWTDFADLDAAATGSLDASTAGAAAAASPWIWASASTKCAWALEGLAATLVGLLYLI